MSFVLLVVGAYLLFGVILWHLTSWDLRRWERKIKAQMRQEAEERFRWRYFCLTLLAELVEDRRKDQS